VFKCWDCQTLNVNSDEEPKQEEKKRKISDVKKSESIPNTKSIETKTEEKEEKLFDHTEPIEVESTYDIVEPKSESK
jgi:hypothetical protein